MSAENDDRFTREPPPPVPPPADPPAPAPARSVLVIEDDTHTFSAMRRLLEHYEFEVVPARTLAEAIRQLDRQPEVILLDLELPDGDGTNVLRRIRHEGRSAQVIILTGTDDPALLRRCQALRPDLVLRKPIDFLRLLALLRNQGPLMPRTAKAG